MPKPKTDKPNASEVAKLKAHLHGRGMKPTDDNAAIGANPTNMTRQQIEATLITWLKTRPHS